MILFYQQPELVDVLRETSSPKPAMGALSTEMTISNNSGLRRAAAMAVSGPIEWPTKIGFLAKLLELTN